MSLIELFTEYVLEKKSLVTYVSLRKNMNQRGEFNDAKLIQAQMNLDRLKKEDIETYTKMYEILEAVYKYDRGYHVEYPIDFIKEVLKMYSTSTTPQEVAAHYAQTLTHEFHDAC